MNNRDAIAVQFDSVSFAYGDVPVLEDVSFHIHRREFAALAGPNGSGKTTVLKLILGLEQPSAGQIRLFGAGCHTASRAWRDSLGYVPQHAPADRAFPIPVRDVVRMGLLHPSRRYSAGNKAAVDEAMEQAGIADLAARPWPALSGGQRRRVLVARALAAKPELLVLDEPAANMDEESESRLYATLGTLKNSATILIVTHDMDYVSVLTDRVLCMGRGGACDAHGVYQRGGIAQHRTEAVTGDGALAGKGNSLRVLHGENIPGNDCCGS